MKQHVTRKRAMCAAMAAVIALSCNVFAAEHTPEFDESTLLNAAQGIIDAEEKYYEIENVAVVNPVCTEKDDGGYYVEYFLELTMQLKYDSATQLPQIRGLADSFNIDSAKLTTQEFVDKMNSAEVMSATVNAVSADAVELVSSLNDADVAILTTSMTDRVAVDSENSLDVLDDNVASKELLVSTAIADAAIADAVSFVQEVESQSIGVSNQFNFALRAEFDSNGNYVGVEYGLAEGYTSDITVIIPNAENEMFVRGEQQASDTMEYAVQKVSKALTAKTASTRANTSFTYKKVSARDYANRYTSNATSHTCTGCINGHDSSNSSIKQDKTKYNSSYSYYCGVDCANFASQVMAAGGVPTSSEWKPDSAAWIGGTSMKEYFLDNGLWTETTFENAAAGEIIQMINSKGKSQHTMVVVLNDTVNRKYSAHTTDRKEYTYSSNSTFTDVSWCKSVEYYKFDKYSLT